MYCSKCGTKISDDALFCKGCGVRVMNSEDKNTRIVSKSEEKKNIVAEAEKSESSNFKSKKMTIKAIVSCIVVATVVSAVCMIVFGKELFEKVRDRSEIQVTGDEITILEEDKNTDKQIQEEGNVIEDSGSKEIEDMPIKADTDHKVVQDFYTTHYNGEGSYPVVADFNGDGVQDIFVIHDSGNGLYVALIGKVEDGAGLVFDQKIEDKGTIQTDLESVVESKVDYNVFYAHKNENPAIVIEITKTMFIAGEADSPEIYQLWFYSDGNGSITSEKVDGLLNEKDIENMADVCSQYTPDGSGQISFQSRITKGIILDDEKYEELELTTAVNDALIDGENGFILHHVFADFDNNGTKEGFIITESDSADRSDISMAGPISAKVNLYYTDLANIAPLLVEGGGEMSSDGYTFNISPSAFIDSFIELINTENGSVFHSTFDSSYESYDKYYGVRDSIPYEIDPSNAPSSAKEDDLLSSNSEWKAAYIKYLNDFNPEYGDKSFMSYYVFNLDDDGIPEILISSDVHNEVNRLISYKNGNVQVYEYGFGEDQYFYPYRNMLCTDWPQMGESDIEYLELTDEGWNKLADSTILYGPGYDDGYSYPMYYFNGEDRTEETYNQDFSQYIDFRFATGITLTNAYVYGEGYNTIFDAIKAY